MLFAGGVLQGEQPGGVEAGRLERGEAVSGVLVLAVVARRNLIGRQTHGLTGSLVVILPRGLQGHLDGAETAVLTNGEAEGDVLLLGDLEFSPAAGADKFGSVHGVLKIWFLVTFWWFVLRVPPNLSG